MNKVRDGGASFFELVRAASLKGSIVSTRVTLPPGAALYVNKTFITYSQKLVPILPSNFVM